MTDYRPPHGIIETIVGPMFSGKTEELFRRVRREEYGNKKIMLFKPDTDTRVPDFDLHNWEMNPDFMDIYSHRGDLMECTVIMNWEPEKILGHVTEDTDIVGIDEAQFFQAGLVDVCEILANARKRVIVAGLDMDYRCEPFPPMDALMAKAEIVTKLTSVCFKCGNPASKIQRFTNGRYSAWDEPVVVIGSNKDVGDHRYEARCRRCYVQPLKVITKGEKDNGK